MRRASSSPSLPSPPLAERQRTQGSGIRIQDSVPRRSSAAVPARAGRSAPLRARPAPPSWPRPGCRQQQRLAEIAARRGDVGGSGRHARPGTREQPPAASRRSMANRPSRACAAASKGSIVTTRSRASRRVSLSPAFSASSASARAASTLVWSSATRARSSRIARVRSPLRSASSARRARGLSGPTASGHQRGGALEAPATAALPQAGARPAPARPPSARGSCRGDARRAPGTPPCRRWSGILTPSGTRSARPELGVTFRKPLVEGRLQRVESRAGGLTQRRLGVESVAVGLQQRPQLRPRRAARR